MPHTISPWPAAAVTLVGLGLRRPLLLVLGAGLATSALAARAWDGLHPPVTGPWSGVATLVTDPSAVAGGLRVEIRLAGKRVEATARGRVAGPLRDRLAGERVALAGTVQPVPNRLRDRAAPRHLAARMTLSRVGGWTGGDVADRVANSLRRTLVAGAGSLGLHRRALFTGFVLGDDRDQSIEITDDFRASGLSHLLVVSGENLAFVLTLIGPILRRFGLRGRMAMGIGVLLLFGVLTRWEPSVLRATAMAAIALLATTLGRPVSTLRILALAVTALLVIDPLLVHSVGFLLSTGACAGIALFGTRLAAVIPGPRVLASAAGVTLAAQIGVAPVLVPVFGGLPLASVPANLLAVPAAGPLMMWGMTAGPVAGLVGEPVASLLHLPTGVLVDWVAAVARWSATLPLGSLTTPHLVLLALAFGLAAVGRRRSRPATVTWAAAVLAGLAVVAPMAVQLGQGPVDGSELVAGARLWRRGGATVLIVDGHPVNTGRLMSALHTAGVRRLDLVVVARPGPAASHAVGPVLERFPAGLVLAPPGHDVASGIIPEPGATVSAGGLELAVETVRPRLVVVVSRRS